LNFTARGSAPAYTPLFYFNAPEAWQCTFQDPASPNMEGIIDLHHNIMFVLIVIVIFVL